jgi:hypothetical protein
MASIRTGISDLQFIDQGVTPTQTGNTTFTLAGNQMQWYPYGNRVKANVGGVNKYATVISSTFTTNTGVTLRFDNFGDVLTTSLSAVATGFPSANNGAVPDNAYKNLNPIMNACHDFWSRGNGPFSISISSASQVFISDRWFINMSATAGCVLSASRFERSASASNVPTVAQAGFLINSALGVSVNGAMASLNAGTFAEIAQRIEGYEFRPYAQKPFTISFWINSRQTGTYCLSLSNAGFDQSIVMPFSISSVATWEKKTLQIPKSPATGTWDYSSGIGLQVTLTLAAGSSLQGGGGNWTAVGILATAAQTNFLASAGNVIMMTAVKINEGVFDTPMDAINVAIETARIRRYVRRFDLSLASRYPAQAVNATQAFFTIHFDDMRIAPTAVTPLNTGGMAITNAALALIATSAMSQVIAGTGYCTFLATQAGAGNLTQGQIAFLAASAGVSIVLSSEL